jgi:hypothetical protein
MVGPMTDTLLPRPSLCPSCGYTLSAAGSIPEDAGRRPSPGDFSVCMNCCQLLAYNDDLTVRAVSTDEKVAAILAQPELGEQIATIEANIRRMHRELGRPFDPLNPRGRKH